LDERRTLQCYQKNPNGAGPSGAAYAGLTREIILAAIQTDSTNHLSQGCNEFLFDRLLEAQQF
jgi:hypothetical protein